MAIRDTSSSNITSTVTPQINKSISPNAFGNSGSDSSDAIWILTSAFIIFTMQSGFGLLESGMVSRKNESNIMVKNIIDVVVGGLSYWIFGYAFSFGQSEYSNEFTGIGSFFTDAGVDEMGSTFAKYFFQLSFATTATTIVSGAMAGRTNLKAYIIFSFTNTISYCFPAHWVWDEKGFLYKLGCIDIAGSAVVHMVGGAASIVAALMLKPRHGRFEDNGNEDNTFIMSSSSNVILGTFMLWWGWLGFNCGSTFGISGGKWKLASRAAVVTMQGSVGGGLFAIIDCYFIRRKTFKGKLDITILSSGILGGLVGITAICAITKPWAALISGAIGGAFAIYGIKAVEMLKIDDPVGCSGVHWIAGIWGMIAVGLFAEKDDLEGLSSDVGIVKGGSGRLLGVQLLACFCITVWSMFTTWLQLYLINKIITLRMTANDELLGADYIEHGILDHLQEGYNVYGQRLDRPSTQIDSHDTHDVLPNIRILPSTDKNVILPSELTSETTQTETNSQIKVNVPAKRKFILSFFKRSTRVMNIE